MDKALKHRGYIYFLLAEKTDCVKIGFTRTTMERRLKLHTQYSPYDYDVLKVIEGTMLQERNLHKRFIRLKIRGEWFKYSDELKDYIESL